QTALLPVNHFIVNQTSARGVLLTVDGQTFSFEPGAIASITIQPAGFNTVDVEAVPANVPVTISLNNGNNVVNISPTAHNLDNIHSSVTVNGTTALNVYDQSNSDGSLLGWSTAYTVTGQSLTRSVSMLSPQGTSTWNTVINYSRHLTGLTLNASNSPNA